MPSNQKWPQKFNIKKPSNYRPFIVLIIISLIIASLVPIVYHTRTFQDNDVSLNVFIENYTKKVYSEIVIDGTKAIAIVDGATIVDDGVPKVVREIAILPNKDSLKELGLNNPEIPTKISIKDKSWDKFWADVLPTLIGFILFVVIAFLIIWRMWLVANNAMSFWKSRAKLYNRDKDRATFADVAWAEEEKEELWEVVDFLKYPGKYKKMWAKIPRWVLLVGPPWTWKTLIARAVAGESKVPFYSISWSEFVEMFVWVGASRVRDLFDQAKKVAPSIVFIDEIDAIWKKRWPWLWWGHDEREQTLNQILTEMDGFDNDTHVIIIAATNRSDVLDPALLRPWRFDRKVTISLPKLDDRLKILEVHAKWKPVSKEVDFKSIASSTVWFSWADLWNLMNEAAIIAARGNEKLIVKPHIQQSLERIVMGLTKKSLIMSDEEKKITAYHEVWHAIVGKLLPHIDPVHKVSIIARGWALWVTWFLPERDKVLIPKAKFLDELATLFWWRVAEEVFFWKDMITTWASNDIERATTIARNMVMRYWMDEEIWPEDLSSNEELWYYGVEWNSKSLSQKTKERIDERVKFYLDLTYKTAKDLIIKHRKLHEKIASDLLEKEEIEKDEFENYFKKMKLPKKDKVTIA